MWRARPIFISSTFLDMQAERDHLRTHVFPALEERLRERRHFAVWVDLRVGVAAEAEADEGAREIQVLKVCLGEVKRCRPFLIVLLGDRYGWIPPPDRTEAMEAAAAGEGFTGSIGGRSLTHLEIDFGVLSNPEQVQRTLFYFREPLPYAQMPEEFAARYSDTYATDAAAAERARSLAALKQRIEVTLPARVRPYRAAWDSERRRVTGLDAFGQMVLEDVWAELADETETFEELEISWQQAERNALDDFAADRARDFVGRDAVLARVTDLCFSPAEDSVRWGMCIIGDPGSGKSALFGKLYSRMKGEDTIVLAHAAGASTQAASIDSMLRRFIDELASALGATVALAENADPETVDKAFASLLQQMAARRRLIVLIDGLDQFETTNRGRYLTWLPQPWSANARFIATAIPGDATGVLAKRRGIEMLPLPSLDAEEARRIIAGICGRYRRTFQPSVIDALLAKRAAHGPAWGNPLWLVLAVEELNLLDEDDFERVDRSYSGPLLERLHHLMLDIVATLPTDVAGLYNDTFERAEKLFGESLARAFLGAIAVSRAGWREVDLRALLPRMSGEPWDALRFANLRRLFRGQMRLRGPLAQWDFNHAQMRAAVLRRLAAMNTRQQSFHAIIVDYLLSCRPDDPLRISETMVHLLGSEDWRLAARYYGDSSLSEAELKGATRALVDGILMATGAQAEVAARRACRLLVTFGVDDVTRAVVANRFMYQVVEAIEHQASLNCRAIVADHLRQNSERLLSANSQSRQRQHDLSLSYAKVGDVQVQQGNLAAALDAYRAMHAILDRLAKADPHNVGWQRDLAVSYGMIGDVQMKQGDLAGALNSYSESLAIGERLVGYDLSNTQWQNNLSASYERLGDMLFQKGDLGSALKAYRDGLAISERLAGSDPGNPLWQRNLSVSQSRVADVLVKQGDLAGALKSYRDGLGIAMQLARTDPTNAQWQRDLAGSYHGIGYVQVQQGDLAGAIRSYRDSLAIAERLAASDAGNAEWYFDLSQLSERVGDVLLKQRDLVGALKSYRDSPTIRAQLAQSDPTNAQRQRNLSVSYNKVGDVLAAQGELADALKSYRDSLAIRTQLARSDPGNGRWQHDLAASYQRIGDVQLVQGEVAAALKSYRDCLAIAERLARSDPTNAQWQRDLAGSHSSIASVYRRRGETVEALVELRKGRTIIAALAAMAPRHSGWKDELGWFDRQIARLE
jgi:tetratricopeptide (TPR) repeat protein